MKYKSEVLVNGSVANTFIIDRASHPNQVVRKTVMAIKYPGPIVIAVMNENGDRWLHFIENGKVRLLKNDMVHYNKDDIVMIMNNHRCIYARNEL